MISTLTGNELKLPEVFSNHSIENYHRCPRRFQYAILERLVPPRMNWAAQFGVAVHESLAAWYRTQNDDQTQLLQKIVAVLRDLSPNLEVSRISADMNAFALRTELSVLIGQAALPPVDDFNAGDHRNANLLEQIIRNYCKLYRYEPFQVVHVEKNFIITISPEILYQGILDLLLRWNSKIVTLDHKTTSSIYNFGDKFTPGHQMTGYILGTKSYMDDVADEACINGIMTARRKDGIRAEDFQRYPNIYRSDEDLFEFMNNTIATVDRMNGDLERGYFPMHTASCNDFGGCPYRDVCKVPASMRDNLLAASFVKRSERETSLESYSGNTFETGKMTIRRAMDSNTFTNIDLAIEGSFIPSMHWKESGGQYDKDTGLWKPYTELVDTNKLSKWINHRAFLDGVDVTSWLTKEELEDASKVLEENREVRLQKVCAASEDIDA